MGARVRGFTIVELLVVLAIISAFAVAAAPSVIAQLRNGRVGDAAQNVADIYRLARTRAMGRGSAMVVRWDAAAAMPTNANPAGHFTVKEALMGAAGLSPFLPSASCTNPLTDFADGSATSKFVVAFDERRKRYEPAVATFLDPDDNIVPYAELCYTPRGRTFIRFAAAGAFVPLLGVPRVEMENTFDGLKRAILLPPTGAARVVGRVQ
jgi:prepilin-type N-terminal cleavage/methylation domain-containing protein